MFVTVYFRAPIYIYLIDIYAQRELYVLIIGFDHNKLFSKIVGHSVLKI